MNRMRPTTLHNKVIASIADLLDTHETDFPPGNDPVPTGVHEQFIAGMCELGGMLLGIPDTDVYEAALNKQGK